MSAPGFSLAIEPSDGLNELVDKNPCKAYNKTPATTQPITMYEISVISLLITILKKMPTWFLRVAFNNMQYF
jgi:hypothetical protein